MQTLARPIYRPTYIETTSPHSLVRQYLVYIEKVSRLAPTTILNRRYILTPFFESLAKDDVRDITIYEIDDLLIAEADRLMASSINATRQYLRSFFWYCADYRKIPLQFDWQQIKREAEESAPAKIFTEDEIADVIARTRNPQDQLMIGVKFETGVRISELTKLSVNDIHGCQIQVRGKGEKDRPVFLTQPTARMLREYLLDRKILYGRVFRPLQPQRGYPADAYSSDKQVRKRIERAFAKCGHEMNPHDLRHSAAVNWLRKGIDIRTIQKMLGHKDLSTTQGYLQIDDPYIEREFRAHMSVSVFQLAENNAVIS